MRKFGEKVPRETEMHLFVSVAISRDLGAGPAAWGLNSGLETYKLGFFPCI